MNILHSIKTTTLLAVAILTSGTAWGEVVEISTAEALSTALSSATTAEYKLTADIAGDFVIPASGNVTIDLNGHKVTNSSGDTFTVTSGGTLTIKGTGTVDNITHAKTCIYNNGTCTLNGGTYTRSAEASTSKENANGNSYYNILNHGTMTINEGVTVSSNGHFSSLIANGYYNYSSTDPRIGYVSDTNQAAPSLTINSGSFSGGVNTVKNDDNSTLTINGGTYSNVTQSAIWNNNKATITGGTFGSSTDGVNALYNNNYNEGVNVVEATITGGTFNAPIVDTQKAKLDISGGTITKVISEGTTTISGGTITTLDAKSTSTVTVAGGTITTISKAEGANVTAESSSTGAATILQAQINATTDGSTIQLTQDITGSIIIPAGKTITLDLNGHKITSTGYAITNNGTLTLKGEQEGSLVKGKFAVCTGTNANTTINSGNYESSEFTVMTGKNTGGTITINGGTFSASDNAVIAGNGSDRSGNANTITINGGTFNGGITTDGYVACGIYAPWKDTFTINGGTFNITGGAGIVARAGTVTVTGGEFNCTGNAEGWVGDSKTSVPSSAIVYDSRSDYPAKAETSQIAITGGSFTSNTNAVTFVNSTGTEDTNQRIAISATETTSPSFSSAVAQEYCTEGFVPTQNADGKYGVTHEFVLTDGEAIPLEEGKTINNVKATYTRTMPTGTKWGTVCLPFTLKQGDGTTTPKLYTYESISGSTLTVTEATEDQAPGTPLLFKYEGSNGVSVFSTESATVNTTALTKPTSGLIGTYTGTTINDTDQLKSTYFINGDKFHQAKVSLTVPAYRAYIIYNNSGSGSAKASTLFISTGDETTAISTLNSETLGTVAAYYDTNGTQITAPLTHGITIVKLHNGNTIKVVK